MVRAGETGGFIDTVLSQIADFQSRDQELKGRVKAALSQSVRAGVHRLRHTDLPDDLLHPRFRKNIDEFGGNLPIMTRIVVGASQWATHYVLVLAGIVVFAVLVARRALASEAGRSRPSPCWRVPSSSVSSPSSWRGRSCA